MISTERNIQYVFHVLSRSSRQPEDTSAIRIPDTLHYQHGSLRNWYFADETTGEVLRRDRRECSKERIMEVFCDGVPEGRPVAVYLHHLAPPWQVGGGEAQPAPVLTGADGRRSSVFVQQQRQLLGTEAAEAQLPDGVLSAAKRHCQSFSGDAFPFSIDYFDAERLEAFLATRDNKHDVLLQRFVDGGTTNDCFSTIEAVWSPHGTFLNQRKSLVSVRQTDAPLHTRCHTFDNDALFNRPVRTTPHMREKVQHECDNIVKHIASVDRRAVIRMVAIFAISRQNCPVLLWVTEMQALDGAQLAPRGADGAVEAEAPAQPTDDGLYGRTAAVNAATAQRLSMQRQRQLCLISPPVVASDVKLAKDWSASAAAKLSKSKRVSRSAAEDDGPKERCFTSRITALKGVPKIGRKAIGYDQTRSLAGPTADLGGSSATATAIASTIARCSDVDAQLHLIDARFDISRKARNPTSHLDRLVQTKAVSVARVRSATPGRDVKRSYTPLSCSDVQGIFDSLPPGMSFDAGRGALFGEETSNADLSSQHTASRSEAPRPASALSMLGSRPHHRPTSAAAAKGPQLRLAAGHSLKGCSRLLLPPAGATPETSAVLQRRAIDRGTNTKRFYAPFATKGSRPVSGRTSPHPSTDPMLSPDRAGPQSESSGAMLRSVDDDDWDDETGGSPRVDTARSASPPCGKFWADKERVYTRGGGGGYFVRSIRSLAGSRPASAGTGAGPSTGALDAAAFEHLRTPSLTGASLPAGAGQPRELAYRQQLLSLTGPASPASPPRPATADMSDVLQQSHATVGGGSPHNDSIVAVPADTRRRLSLFASHAMEQQVEHLTPRGREGHSDSSGQDASLRSASFRPPLHGEISMAGTEAASLPAYTFNWNLVLLHAQHTRLLQRNAVLSQTSPGLPKTAFASPMDHPAVARLCRRAAEAFATFAPTAFNQATILWDVALFMGAEADGAGLEDVACAQCALADADGLTADQQTLFTDAFLLQGRGKAAIRRRQVIRPVSGAGLPTEELQQTRVTVNLWGLFDASLCAQAYADVVRAHRRYEATIDGLLVALENQFFRSSRGPSGGGDFVECGNVIVQVPYQPDAADEDGLSILSLPPALIPAVLDALCQLLPPRRYQQQARTFLAPYLFELGCISRGVIAGAAGTSPDGSSGEDDTGRCRAAIASCMAATADLEAVGLRCVAALIAGDEAAEFFAACLTDHHLTLTAPLPASTATTESGIAAAAAHRRRSSVAPPTSREGHIAFLCESQATLQAASRALRAVKATILVSLAACDVHTLGDLLDRLRQQQDRLEELRKYRRARVKREEQEQQTKLAMAVMGQKQQRASADFTAGKEAAAEVPPCAEVVPPLLLFDSMALFAKRPPPPAATATKHGASPTNQNRPAKRTMSTLKGRPKKEKSNSVFSAGPPPYEGEDDAPHLSAANLEFVRATIAEQLVTTVHSCLTSEIVGTHWPPQMTLF